MATARIKAIEYIRGIAMLGVVGIHTGAYSLTNPDVNIHLFAIFEIVTRFSVPIFFFISAFGLFYRQSLDGPFSYRDFFIRRLRTVLLPYVTWSLLYMLHYTWASGDSHLWQPPLLYEYFIFGLASYQLYFLVILLWFYALMPLWRSALRRIIRHPGLYLGIILAAQIIFNYYSSYLVQPTTSSHYLNLAIQHRMSYLVLHYIFIFLLGAVSALKFSEFKAWLTAKNTRINWLFGLTLAGMLAYYYILIYLFNYTPEQAVNKDHQLSPIGVLYTFATTLFLFNILITDKLSQDISNTLGRLGEHSYMVYLVHPLVMYYLASYISNHKLVMTDPIVFLFYVLTICFSLIIAISLQKINRHVPLLGLLLIGTPLRK